MQETPRIVRFVGQAVFQAISGKEEENGNADMSEIRSQESHVDACMENEDGDYQHEPQSFGDIGANASSRQMLRGIPSTGPSSYSIYT